MELVKFFVELRYKQPHKLFRVYEELHTALVGKPPAEKEPVLLPGFGLNVQDKKMRVLIDPRRSVVDLEHTPNTGYCLDTITQVFRKIDEIAPLPDLLRLGARSWWLRAAAVSFDALVTMYKEKLFHPSVFVQNARDVGTSFVLVDENNRANINFGPMEAAQLKGMLFSEVGNLPSVFTFLDVDYSLTENELKYEEKQLRDFAKRALDFSAKQGEILQEVLPEVHK